MDRFLTKTEFARLVGIKVPSVTYLCKPGKRLHESMTGKKIDTNHPEVKRYLDEHEEGAKKAKVKAEKAIKRPTAKKAITSDGHEYTPIDILEAHPSEFLDLTMREILSQFGSMEEFKTALNARKMISEINYKELQSSEKRGELIPREIVKTHIFGAMDTSNLRMLRDVPKTVTTKAIAMIKSGQKAPAVEEMIRDLVGKNLDVVRKTATRILSEV